MLQVRRLAIRAYNIFDGSACDCCCYFLARLFPRTAITGAHLPVVLAAVVVVVVVLVGIAPIHNDTIPDCCTIQWPGCPLRIRESRTAETIRSLSYTQNEKAKMQEIRACRR